MSDDQQGRAAAPAPNVKPKLGQTEKKEKPPKERRSRSTNSEREDGGRGRDRDRHRGDRSRRRGRSEEARGRGGGGGAGGAARPPEDEVRDTECAVCFCSYDNVFRTPKLLACGHTFCLECLARINVTAPHLKTLSCPVCREVTKLPHGRDLPRLGTNKDVIGRLPPGMRRVLSIRFLRRKGRLQLKNPGPALPRKGRGGAGPAGGHVDLGALEQGAAAAAPATVVNVGRPPNRVRGRMRRLFRSDQCFYAVVASVITITVVLMLVGVLAFVIIPNMPFNRRPVPGGNQTSDRPPG